METVSQSESLFSVLWCNNSNNSLTILLLLRDDEDDDDDEDDNNSAPNTPPPPVAVAADDCGQGATLHCLITIGGGWSLHTTSPAVFFVPYQTHRIVLSFVPKLSHRPWHCIEINRIN